MNSSPVYTALRLGEGGGGGGGGGVPFIQSLVQYYSSNVYSLHYLPCYIVSQNAMTMCVCACACVCVGVCVCVCVCVPLFQWSCVLWFYVICGANCKYPAALQLAMI